MTLHNSKGLEFEAVFIVGLEEDLFPHVNSKNSLEEIEEERRLFYVGITRAKKILYITHSQYRFLWGSVKFSIPSRFLKELDKRYVANATSSFEDFEDDESDDENSNIEFIDKRSTAHEENKKYFIGQKVYHNTFGEGKIEKIYQTSLGDTLDILFNRDNSTRSIVEKYAKLKIL
jgi:DNA helicase II / ATP-dependent DNA helicase PcrA